MNPLHVACPGCGCSFALTVAIAPAAPAPKPAPAWKSHVTALPPVPVEAPAPRAKARKGTCGCGHELARHDAEGCMHGRGTAFGGCPCEGFHSRRRGDPKPKAASTGSKLPPGERKILIAVLQHGEVTRKQLTVITRYKRSSRDTYLQRLGAKGLITEGRQGAIASAPGAEEAVGDYERLPTGDQLLAHYLETLPPGESTILRVVTMAHPEPVIREQLSETTGYKRSSRDTYVQRLVARQLVEEVGRGAVRASDALFDEVRR